MGVFDSIRNIVKNHDQQNPLWNLPDSVSELEAVFDKTDKPQVIYKHSSRCSISFIAQRSLESGMQEWEDRVDYHLVNVITHRPLSAFIAEKTGIRHESPQLILLSGGEPFWSISHGGVRAESLRKALEDQLYG